MVPSKLFRYSFNKMAFNAFIILFAISLLLLTLQATKFLDLIIGRGMPMKFLLYISFLSMPAAWNEVLPIGGFLSIIFTYHTLTSHNETVIMKAVGLTPFQIAKPSLIIGLVISFICFLFSLFIINYTFVSYLKLRSTLAQQFNLKIVGTNKFIQLTPNVTIYVGGSGKNGRMKNVLVDSEQPNEENTIYASYATIVKSHKSVKVLLQKGSLQKLDKKTNSLTFFNFDYYVLNVSQNIKHYKTMRTTARSLYLWELIFYNHLTFMKNLKKYNPAAYKYKVKSFMVETNKRLVNIVLSFALAVIAAYFFSTFNFQRNQRYMPALKSIFSGVLLKVLCTTFLISSSSLIVIFTTYALIFLFIGYLLFRLIKHSSST